MRIWVDMSAPAHVLVLRPIIERLRGRGHEVMVTSRDYTQTQELLDLHGMEHTPIGRHGGASRVRKLTQLISRTRQMRKFGSSHEFDLAIAHGSNDLAIAARAGGIPEANMHDYEFAVAQHHVGCRLATRVLFPDAVPAERLRRFGVTDEKLFQYPGFKEEYYLADFEPDPSVFSELELNREKVIVIVRPPPDVSLYHRKSNPLFPQVLAQVGADPGVQAVVLPRTPAQREFVRSLELPSLIVPDHAVDGQSLIALADLVVSAGGTMNREAVALGSPVYTTYGGRLGGVDEALIRSGKLRPLTDPRAIELRKRPELGRASRRDPDLLVDVMLGAATEGRRGGGAIVRGEASSSSLVAPPAGLVSRQERANSLAAEYARTSHAYERRGIDVVLRGFDLVLAGGALLVLSPVVLLVTATIRLTSGRPILYRGPRVGRFGEIFQMYKFRTLKADAEERLGPYYGKELTRRTEAEVTRVGRALRATHLDEFPQLWNVLRGEMSVVGPRPIRPSFFLTLGEKVPQYWQRLVVRPGVTGFAQTRITREEAWEFKLAHDLEYIADRSIRLYLRVLGATVLRIFRRAVRGVRRRLRRPQAS